MALAWGDVRGIAADRVRYTGDAEQGSVRVGSSTRDQSSGLGLGGPRVVDRRPTYVPGVLRVTVRVIVPAALRASCDLTPGEFAMFPTRLRTDFPFG